MSSSWYEIRTQGDAQAVFTEFFADAEAAAAADRRRSDGLVQSMDVEGRGPRKRRALYVDGRMGFGAS